MFVIVGVCWCLEQLLWLGQSFNQPIEQVDFPPSLQQLRFGHDFNQDVERVRWPPGLQVRYGTVLAGVRFDVGITRG